MKLKRDYGGKFQILQHKDIRRFLTKHWVVPSISGGYHESDKLRIWLMKGRSSGLLRATQLEPFLS